MLVERISPVNMSQLASEFKKCTYRRELAERLTHRAHVVPAKPNRRISTAIRSHWSAQSSTAKRENSNWFKVQMQNRKQQTELIRKFTFRRNDRTRAILVWSVPAYSQLVLTTSQGNKIIHHRMDIVPVAQSKTNTHFEIRKSIKWSQYTRAERRSKRKNMLRWVDRGRETNRRATGRNDDERIFLFPFPAFNFSHLVYVVYSWLSGCHRRR